jgi:GPH family glycoside/pentoside/hexuronide:cation symporter
MTLFAGIAVGLLLATFFTTRERVSPPPGGSSTLKQDVRDLLRNKPWILLFFIGLLFVTMTTLKQGATMFYFKYFLGDVPLAAAFMISGLLAAMGGAGVTGLLARRFGKRRVLFYSFTGAGLSSAALFFAGPQDLMPVFVLSIITEFCTGPIVTLFFAMLADTADFSEWKTHRSATGLVFSAGTLSMKFGTGVAGALTGWMLTMFGYAANVTQTPESLLGIRLLISIFPAAAATLALLVVALYPLDKEELLRIRTDLLSRKKRA